MGSRNETNRRDRDRYTNVPIVLINAEYLQEVTDRAFENLVNIAVIGVEKCGHEPFEAVDRVTSHYDYADVEAVLDEVQNRIDEPGKRS